MDGALALIAAGEIEIDVGPLAAFLGKKALEEQFHFDRIDGRDAERIADRAVGGRSTALHQNVLAAAEVDDVPNDQEIAGQVELFDEREFAIDLAAGAAAQIDGFGMIAIHGAFFGALSQERIHAFAGRHGVARELVAEIGERELQAIGKRAGVGDGFGKVGKEPRHFLRAFQMALGVDGEQAAGFVNGGLVADAGEDVERFARIGRGVGDAVGGEEREPVMSREIDECLIERFFGAIVMALEFDKNIFVAECFKEHGVGAGGEADQAGGELGEFFRQRRAFAFFGAHFHSGDQAAEVLIAGAIFGQQRVAMAVGAGDFGADVGADAGLFRGHVEAGGAGDVVAVEDGEGGEVERGGAGDQFFRDGGAFEEAEGGAGVEFEVPASHRSLR